MDFISNAQRLDWILEQRLTQMGGIAGPPNTIAIGSVQSGDVASAEFTGQSPNQTLHLVLPRGERGEAGTPGAPGARGAEGVQGPRGAPGVGAKPDGYGTLTEAFMTATEAAGVNLLYVVTQSGDLRANKTIPAGLNGDMSRHLISFDAATSEWSDLAPFTGVQGPEGPEGKQGPAGRDGQPGLPGAPGVPGTNGTNGKDGKDGLNGLDGQPGPPGLQGIQGIPGPAGKDGLNGTPGTNGKDGAPYIATQGNLAVSTINFTTSPDVVRLTVSGPTTWTMAGFPTTGTVAARILEITNGGLGAQTFPASVKWSKGTKPTLQTAGTDIIGFFTGDGGNTIRAIFMSGDSK